ncbi:MAG: DUF1343 domain-containing protein [Deltaproteobacteria bacterium]|jgi:uncharacterized protein YbbC (DUF1343 family)|nr:DUF1343 domain-containing protein [Deltaproteobacteria bacterium]
MIVPSRTGLEVFLARNAHLYRDKTLALFANQASVGPGYIHSLAFIDSELPGSVIRLFSPQHGFYGEKQDNMIPSAHFRMRDGRDVYSLYGETRSPTDEMMKGLDAVVADLQDVGTRVYTFQQSLSLLLEKAGETGTEIVVLDRPNPIGGLAREGNLTDPDCLSFVGLHPLPMRHGLTMGELALYMNSRLKKPARLSVSPMLNWWRKFHFSDTKLPWVAPSPNMPDPVTALLYPGTVLFEGTTLSEGRGTTQPFRLVGSPFIDSAALKKYLDAQSPPGAVFREVCFEPCFNKHAGKVCRGVEIHPVSRSFQPLRAALTILEAVLRLHPKENILIDPPYEYDYERRPIDLILGRKSVFDALRNGESAWKLCEGFQDEVSDFNKIIKDFLLYPD